MKIQVIQTILCSILLITVDVLALNDHAQLTAMRFHYHYEEQKTRLVLEFSEKVNYIEKKGSSGILIFFFWAQFVLKVSDLSFFWVLNLESCL